MPIKVRVGQADAVKILSSAGGGSVESFSSKNVIGGIASVTQLDVTGISTFNGNINATGVTTFTSDVIFQGAAANQNITFDASENDLEFSDNARLKFGNSDDLEIWHSGNSHIKNDTGDLKIRGDSIILKRGNDSEAYLKATVNSDVKIYYNGNEKFATTNEGVLVSGLTTTGTLSVTGISTFNDNVFIRNPAGETIIFKKEGDAFFNGIVTATEADIGNGGLNVDGNVGIGSEIPSEKLDVAGNIKVNSGPVLGTSTTYDPGGALRITSPSGVIEVGAQNNNYAHFITDRGRFYFGSKIIVDEGKVGSYNEDLVLMTNVDDERIRIKNDDGHVGINTNDPQGDLQIGTGVTVYGNAGIVSATTFKGALEGRATSASLSLFSFMKNNSDTDETVFPVFVDGDGNQVAQELEVDSGFTYNPSTGILSATTFKGSLTGDVTGNAGTATSLANARTIGGVSFDGTANIDLPGVNTAGNQNTTGTAGGLSGTPSITVQDITAEMVSIGGTLSYEDVTNVDSVGIITAQTGVRISTGGLVVTSGVSTFSGIATFTENVFVEGTLTAALIDGGVF